MHFLNFGLTSSAPEVLNLANRIFAECVEPTYCTLRPKIKAKCLDKLVRLLANLYQAEYNTRFGTSPGVHYSRSRSGYVDFQTFSFDVLVLRFIEHLSPKYLHRIDTPGDKFFEDGADTQLSAIVATKCLSRLFVDFSPKMFRNDSDVVICKEKPPKRGKPKIIELPAQLAESPEAVRTKDVLVRTNARLQNAFIGWFNSDDRIRETSVELEYKSRVDSRLTPFNVFNKHLRRTFAHVSCSSQQLDRNGRISGGWWQSIPSMFRNNCIWLEDEFGYECDYQAMEVAIAYAHLGLRAEDLFDDAYAIPSLPQLTRPVSKTILLVLLNGGREAGVKQALLKQENKARRRIGKPPLTEDSVALKDLLPEKSNDIGEVIEAIEDTHHRLIPYMRLDTGLERMKTESDIALRGSARI